MTNCLFYAVAKYIHEGGVVCMRKSHKGWWVHFGWTKDFLTFWQYVPNDYRIPWWWILPGPPWLFNGNIKHTSEF